VSRRNIHKIFILIALDLFNMSAKVRTKYVTLDGCGTARFASSLVVEAIQELAEEMSPTRCQEEIGCTRGCLEAVQGKALTDKDCRTFSECLDGCRATANKTSVQFKAPKKTGTTITPRTPPKGCAAKGQKEEGSYVKMRSEYNRLMGHYQTRRRSAAARAPEKATETLPKVREGSAEDLLRQHNRALGRKRGAYY
jgi:hypothetical protein